MNAAVITKIEYRLDGVEEFSVFDIVPESGKLKQENKPTGSGKKYTTVVDFLIAGMSIELDQLMKNMDDRKAYFRITDADNIIYMVGSSDYPARLVAPFDLGGAPGSFKGYRCSITQISTTGYTIQ